MAWELGCKHIGGMLLKPWAKGLAQAHWDGRAGPDRARTCSQLPTSTGCQPSVRPLGANPPRQREHGCEPQQLLCLLGVAISAACLAT